MTDEPAPPHREHSLTLGDALKLAGVAATGGQAKLLIQSGRVEVNGQIETRRKRRVGPGDVIGVGGEEFEIGVLPE
jgi:ribosome-associated protein